MPRLTLPRLAALLGLLVFGPLSVAAQSHLLSNIVVVGTIAGDGAFHGVLTITQLVLHETGQLVATGTLGSTAETQGTHETFTARVDHLRHGDGPSVCASLVFDLAPPHFDGRALTVDVSWVHLDIIAQRGSDTLLGQLLCALTYLLEDPSGNMSGIQVLLNAINPRLSAKVAS
jgi:hypothetical protein